MAERNSWKADSWALISQGAGDDPVKVADLHWSTGILRRREICHEIWTRLDNETLWPDG